MESHNRPPILDSFDETDSIDLAHFLTDEVTSSGSFDVRGVQATPFGKLLQGIPIPALLIDRSFCIVFANNACTKISAEYGKTLGSPLSGIFPDLATAGQARSIIEEVFSARTPRVHEAILQIEKNRIWGRMHFRSLRIGEERAVLLLVEDLSLEKKQLLLSQRYQEALEKEIKERQRAEEALEKANQELEERIRARTSELLKLNKELAQEISERRHAQKLLYDSQHRLELALLGADLGLWDYDVRKNEVFVNHVWVDMLGYSLDEIEPHVKFWQGLMHPDDKPGVIEAWTRHLEGRSSFYEAEHRLKAKSGEWKWLLVRGRVMERDKDGKPLRFSGTAFNVTDRKRAEEKLLQLSKVFMEALDPILVRDLDGAIVDLNQAAEETYGWRRDELIGKPFKTLVHPDRHARVDELREQCKRGERVENVEALHRTKSGETIPVLLSLSLLTDQKGKPIGIASITKNLTDLKRTEDMLRARTEALERSNKELEQFAYVVAHDLREPLVGVAAYVKMLKRHYRDTLDAEARKFIGSALDIIFRMDSLIQGLLAYSRLGTMKPSLERTDCNMVRDTAISNLKSAIGASRATVTSETLPTLMADPLQLGQLFQNLLSNAIKFAGDRPLEIHIGAVREESQWKFYVKDNGIGIEPPYLNRIFRIFERLENAAGRAGHGIGLANCKKIVEQHGGRIWAESEPGDGSTFFFTIPDRIAARE